MVLKLMAILMLPIIGMGIHVIYRTEVDPRTYTCHHKKQIKGDPDTVFQYLLTSPHALEKLLPWLMRFKEADKRIVSPGKSYSAIVGIPFLGERLIYATLADYKPSKLMIFEFSRDLLNQRVIVQTRNFHDRTLLEVTVYLHRPSWLFQNTIGYAIRAYIKGHLEISTKNLAAVVEQLDGPNKIPDFSKSKT